MTTQSEAFFNVLLSNGLKDKSFLYVPNWGARFKKDKPYKWHYHESVFGKGKGKRRLSISIDFDGLVMHYAGCPLTETYTEIDDQKIRSIIAFFHCSTTKQETIMKYFGGSIERIGEDYENAKAKGYKLIAPLDKSFGNIYEQVAIV